MTTVLADPRFDYSDIDADSKGKLIWIGAEINKHKSASLTSMLAMGESIAQAQELLAHKGDGTFGKWVETECGIAKRSAYNYMAAWKRFGDCASLARTLTAEAVFKLSAASAPDDAATKAKKLAASGVRVTAKVAYGILHSGNSQASPTGASNGRVAQSTNSPISSNREPEAAAELPQLSAAHIVIVKDQWGATIQEHARKAFAAVPQFEEILKLLRQAGRLYSQLAEQDGGKLLQQSGISVNARSGFRHAGIVNVIRDLEACKPTYTICPYSVNEHQKHGKDCTLCHGLNWSPKIPKDRVPERLITKAQKQACST